MANVFKPKRSSTSSSVPTTGDLTDGELAVNSADKIIYLRDGGDIVAVANYSTGTGTGESYWVSTAAGIHTLSNVGIGTTIPTKSLDVRGDGDFQNLYIGKDYVFNGSPLQITNRGQDIIRSNGRLLLRSGSSSDIAPTIELTNLVGLSIYGGSSSNGVTISGGAQSGASGGNVKITQGDLLVGTSSPTGTASQKLQVTGGAYISGSVGIGSTQPTATLDVGGTLNVSGISTFNDDLYIPNDTYLRFGNNNDYTIYFNGTVFQFDGNNIGSEMRIRNNGPRIRIGSVTNGETGFLYNRDGSVELYYDNVKKFETTGAGATVYGTTETQQLSVSGVATATSFSGSGINLTGIVTSITAGSGISINQSTGNVTVSSSLTTTEHKILDDISSSFNGSTTQFTISSSSTNFLNSEITTAARLLISVGGVVQQPDPTQTNGFYISGGTDISTDPIKINFVEAPKTGQSFFGVAYGLSVSPTTAFTTAEQSIAYSIMFGV